ncbi:uncharacterized protein LOC127856260 isoform X4 [Dreissena polymorpha]|uniref:uncharacterized protein LOC127856260 isoform X4 n=1 Tax=Dreissena polymorpha TaxID=45954 RepID=UPI0022646C6B|nr:uncharacterized protein LOC127856260 isoform X4 [Dreissena polymorpha]
MNCRIVIDFNHVEISIVQAIGNMKVPIVGAVVLLACLATVQSLVCLNCPDAAHPRFCKHVTTCSVGEKCGIETFVSTDGDLLYKLGCVDTNFCTATPSLKSQNGNHGNQFVACQSCCDNHDLCNDVGCNSTGFPINRGPICFNCEALPGDYACHKVEHCEPHEVCFKDATLEFQTDMMYSSGCRSKHNCADNIVDPVVLLGKRHVTDDVYTENKRSVSVCTSCCAGDLCNVQCKGTGQYPPPTTTSTTLSTTLQTTVSSTMSTDTTTTTTMTWLQSTPELPPVVGMRVERGPDWHWLNQDGNGPGRIVDVPMAGWVNVKWDNTGIMNSYRYGYDNKHDVQPLSATTTTAATTTGAKSGTTTGAMSGTTIGSMSWTTTGATTGTMNGTTAGTMSGTTIGASSGNKTGTMSGIATGTISGTTTAAMSGTTTVTMYGTTTGVMSWTTTGATANASETDAFNVGDVVVRGTDWRYGSQDEDQNGFRQIGKVVAVPPQTPPQWVEVEWPGGYSNTYRVGFEGHWDIRAP